MSQLIPKLTLSQKSARCTRPSGTALLTSTTKVGDAIGLQKLAACQPLSPTSDLSKSGSTSEEHDVPPDGVWNRFWLNSNEPVIQRPSCQVMYQLPSFDESMYYLPPSTYHVHEQPAHVHVHRRRKQSDPICIQRSNKSEPHRRLSYDFVEVETQGQGRPLPPSVSISLDLHSTSLASLISFAC